MLEEVGLFTPGEWNSGVHEDGGQEFEQPVISDESAQAPQPRSDRFLDLSRLRNGGTTDATSCLAGSNFEIQLILNGYCRVPLPRQVRQLGAGHIVLRDASGLSPLRFSADFESVVVQVPSATLQELCLEHGWLKPDGRSAFSATPLPLVEQHRILRLFDLVREEADAHTTPPEVLQHYARVLACKLILTLDQVRLEGMADSHAQCFARLAQYVDDNIRNDITAEQLAQHAGLSLRSLYLLFERNAHMTPKAYIREKKLEHVYAMLMDPASRAANVTAVALEFGFTHLGRFAELYRKTFGMLPSKSLKARQGPEKVE